MPAFVDTVSEWVRGDKRKKTRGKWNYNKHR